MSCVASLLGRWKAGRFLLGVEMTETERWRWHVGCCAPAWTVGSGEISPGSRNDRNRMMEVACRVLRACLDGGKRGDFSWESK